MPMNEEVENILFSILGLYVESGKLIRTDRDQDHHHDNEIPVIIERNGKGVLFRTNQDWYFRNEKRAGGCRCTVRLDGMLSDGE